MRSAREAGRRLARGVQDFLARIERLEPSESPRCPKCGKPNYCEQHDYVYRKWLEGYRESF